MYDIYTRTYRGLNKGLYIPSQGGTSPESIGNLLFWFNPETDVISDGAAHFGSSNPSFLTIADAADLSSGDVDFTWCGWFKPTSLTVTKTLFGKYNETGNQREWLLRITSSNFHIRVSTDGITNIIDQSFATSVPSLNNWHFVVFRHDAINNQVVVRINATDYTFALTGGILDGTSSFQIGTFNSGTDSFDGDVDSLAKWNRYLSNAELDFLYNSGSGKVYSDLGGSIKADLITWWDLDESTGNRFDSHNNHTLTNTACTSEAGIAAGFATDGDVVKTWRNSINNTQIIGNPTFASRPMFFRTGNNGQQEVKFDGIDDSLSGFFNKPSSISIYSVIKQIGWATGSYIFDGTSNNNGALIQSGLNSGGLTPSLIINAGNTGASATGLATGVYGIVTTIFAPNSGYLQVNNFTAVTGNVGANSLNNLRLGARGDGTNFSNISFSEILIYSGVHSDLNKTSVKDYLTTRWGIII